MMNDTHDVIVVRTLDAAREEVWRAWSDPDQVVQWWGPQGFTSPMCRMDFRVGGTTLVSMRSADGVELFNTWTYRSIEPMERIEFVNRFSDADGDPVEPADLGLPRVIPAEVRHEVTLRAIDDRTTELTVHEFGYPNEQIVEVSKAGMEQCIDKMAASLSKRSG
jgi:uncharacterized protein YndB with AHSA1/START domain